MATALMSVILAGCGSAEAEDAAPVTEIEDSAAEDEIPETTGDTVEEADGDTEAEETETAQEKEYMLLMSTKYNADGSMETATKYIYDESGNTPKEISYAADGSIKSSIEREYDGNGNCIKSVSRDANGNITESVEYEHYGSDIYPGYMIYDADGNMTDSNLHEYDDKGNEIKHTSFYKHSNDDGSYTTDSQVQECEYDDKGNKIKETYTGTTDFGDGINNSYGGVYEYEYDDHNQMIKQIYYMGDEDLVTTVTEYAYDGAGNCISETECYADGSVASTISREYDSDNNLIKEAWSDANGTVYQFDEYEYDNRGNMIKYLYNYYNIDSSNLDEYEYDDNNRYVKQISYSDGTIESITCWEYDDFGNTVKMIRYNADESLSCIIEYEYMELQDYLAAKESIDQEEIAILNVEPLENISSIAGTSNAEMESAEADGTESSTSGAE